MSEEFKTFHENNLALFREESKRKRIPLEMVTIPLSIHVTHRDDGTGGVSESEVFRSLERVNAHYKEALMEFFACELIHHDNTDLYNR